MAPTYVLLASLFALGCGAVDVDAITSPSQPENERTQACAALCTYTLLHCRQEKRAYASESACRESCDAVAELGAPGDARGDSIHCRLTYAVLAKETLTMWFCQNASATGGLQCR